MNNNSTVADFIMPTIAFNASLSIVIIGLGLASVAGPILVSIGIVMMIMSLIMFGRAISLSFKYLKGI